jgi:flagellar hook-length control protein FliK
MMISASVPLATSGLEQSGERSPAACTESAGDDFSGLLFLVLATRPVESIPAQGAFQPAVAENGPVVSDPSDSLCTPSLLPCPDQSMLGQSGETIAAAQQEISTQGDERLVPESNDFVSAVAKEIHVGVSLLTNQDQPPLAGLEEAPAGISERSSESPAALGNASVAILGGLVSASVLSETGQNSAAQSEQASPTLHMSEGTLGPLSRQNLSLYRDLGMNFTADPESVSEASGVQEQKTTHVLMNNGEDQTKLGGPSAALALRQTPITQAAFAKQNLPPSLLRPTIEDAQIDAGPDNAISSLNFDGMNGNLAIAVPVAKVRLAQDQNQKFSFDDHGGKAFSEASSPSHEYSAQLSDPAVTVSSLSSAKLESLRAGDEKSPVSRPPVIDQVADGIVANLRLQKHEAVIALDPPELGNLKINLTLEDGKVQIRILAETHESRHLIENHLSELKQALQVHRLDLVDARVDGGSWNGAKGDLMHSFQRGPDSRQQGGWNSGDLLQPTDESPDIQKPDATPSSTGRVSMWA